MEINVKKATDHLIIFSDKHGNTIKSFGFNEGDTMPAIVADSLDISLLAENKSEEYYAQAVAEEQAHINNTKPPHCKLF